MERITHMGVQVWPRTKVGRFTSLKSKIRAFIWKWFVVRLGILTAVVAMALTAYWMGISDTSRELVAVNTIAPQESMAAVMQRIADCESGSGKAGSGHQFNSNGTVVTHTNSNGSVDVGKFELNLSAAHIQEMSKLGFNPLTEAGNTAYAQFLYQNRGTGDWSSSQHCWLK